MKRTVIIITIVFTLFLCVFCEKEGEELPVMEFKTGSGYIYQDSTVSRGATLKAGIIATRAEENLKVYNVSVAYDGARTTLTVQEYSVLSDETGRYEKDVVFSVRNQPGTEKFYFTIVDVDGNIAQKNISLKVE